jgi:hypothetical protein
MKALLILVCSFGSYWLLYAIGAWDARHIEAVMADLWFMHQDEEGTSCPQCKVVWPCPTAGLMIAQDISYQIGGNDDEG